MKQKTERHTFRAFFTHHPKDILMRCLSAQLHCWFFFYEALSCQHEMQMTKWAFSSCVTAGRTIGKHQRLVQKLSMHWTLGSKGEEEKHI